jgi:hypothetical protein
VLETHRRPDGTLGRASVDGVVSEAVATLEDYGGLAGGLLELALASGDVEAATAARELVDLCLEAAEGSGADGGDCPFGVPGGGDPLLRSTGLAVRVDPSEGAYPSGLTATASAAHTLFLMTASRRYERAAREAMRLVAGPAASVPSAFGAALALMSRLEGEPQQLVVVSAEGAPDDPEELIAAARRHSADLVALVDAPQGEALADAGFELFTARGTRDGLPTAYLCRDFVCRLPVTSPAGL